MQGPLGMALAALIASAVACDQASTTAETTRCPVCGMAAGEYPSWQASIVYQDGRRVFFDGPKDMFRYYLNLSKYEKEATVEDIQEIWVTEYYSTQPVRASEVLYVLGSDVRGPMGRELVPLKSRAEAETFLDDHRGEKILHFDEVSQEDLSGL